MKKIKKVSFNSGMTTKNARRVNGIILLLCLCLTLFGYFVTYTNFHFAGINSAQASSACEEAVRLFNIVNNKMRCDSYTAISYGLSTFGKTELIIDGCRSQHRAEAYLERKMCGGKILGINADFAYKFFRKNETFRYCDAKGDFVKKGKHIAVRFWNPPNVLNRDAFLNKFGQDVTKLFYYEINERTVETATVNKNDDGSFKLYFKMSLKNGLASEGIKTYVEKQVPALSGKNCKSFDNAELTIMCSPDNRIKTINILESYTVKTGIAIKPTIKVTTNITEDFKYPENVSVPHF